MRIGYFQFNPSFKRPAENRKKVVKALSSVSADLIVLPELAFTGYNFSSRDELWPLAEYPEDSPAVFELAELCAKGGNYIVSGFAEKHGDNLYNAAILVGPNGLEYVYRTLHLFQNEKKIFSPGDQPLGVCRVNDAKIGIMICFDWIFPEVARTLALRGAQIICQPANLVLSLCQDAMITRCIENGVFGVTANRYGAEKSALGTLKFTGKSQIVNPKGELLNRSRAQKEDIFITDIDPAQANIKNITKLNHLMNDRRPEFYAPLCDQSK